MTILDRYIIRQLMATFGILALILSSAIWLIQTLKLLEIVIEHNQDAIVFFELALFYLPYVLSLVLPVVLLCAAFYVLHRLRTDSELIVILAAGVNRWGLIRPVITFAGFIAILTLVINSYITPAALRQNRDTITQIRADIASFMIQEGQFINPTQGVTVYVQNRSPGGAIHNIMLQDDRNPDERLTYIAQSGTLVVDDTDSLLVMYNGTVQRSTGQDGTPPSNTLSFEQYSINVSDLIETSDTFNYDSRELFIQELLFPDPENLYEKQQINKFLARGHDHLTSPLFCFVYALIALATFLPGIHNRRENYAWRIAVAALIAIVLRIAQFSLVSLATRNPVLLPALYMIPAGACLIAIFVLFEKNPLKILSRTAQMATRPQQQDIP